MRFYYILRRWLLIVVYSIIGGLISAALFQYGTIFFNRYKYNLPDSNYDVLIILYYGLFLFGIIILNQKSRVKFWHFSFFITHPPFIISVLTALLITPLITRLTSQGIDNIYPTYRQVACISLSYVLIFILQRFILWIHQIFNNLVSPPSKDINVNASTILELSDAQIIKWIKIEKPIKSPDQDLFQFNYLANRVYEKINEGIGTTLAIVGKFGSGKSSLIELIEGKSKDNQNKKLWFVKINCWGFEDSTKAQEIILKQTLVSLSKRVDCLSIYRIPARYIEAISKLNRYVDAFLTAFDASIDPLTELQKISLILLAVKARLIIIIEDTDRNGVKFNAEDLEALLFRLKQVEGISFILTTDTSSKVDFAKLCEYSESIPNLDVDQSLRIISTVRKFCLDSYLDDIHPISYEDSLRQDREGPDAISSPISLYQTTSWQDSLVDLLSTPRYLKRTLRRTINAWERLHGEVDINELLIITALRETATPAFSFLNRHYQEIRSLSPNSSDDHENRLSKNKIQNLKENWNEIIERSNFDSTIVSILMREILPATDFLFSNIYNPTTKTIQGIKNKDAPIDYGERYFSESILENHIRDQSVLQTIKKINSGNSEGINDASKNIFESKIFSEILVYYGDRIEEDNLLPLLSSLYKLIRVKMGSKAYHDKPGFIELWNYGRNKFPQLPGFKTWIYSEIRNSFPNNIKFVNALCYWWCPYESQHIDTELVRQYICDLSKEYFKKLSSKDFANCFDEDYPWSLSWLVFIEPRNEIDVSISNAPDWSWLGPVLIDASKEVPEKINPQIAFMCKIQNQSFFDYDNEVLDGIFGDRKNEIMQELAKPYEVNPNFSKDDQVKLKSATKKAQQWPIKNA